MVSLCFCQVRVAGCRVPLVSRSIHRSGMRFADLQYAQACVARRGRTVGLAGVQAGMPAPTTARSSHTALSSCFSQSVRSPSGPSLRRRCCLASYMVSAAATLMLNDSTKPCMGMMAVWSAMSSTVSDTPVFSLPSTKAVGRVKSTSCGASSRRPAGRVVTGRDSCRLQGCSLPPSLPPAGTQAAPPDGRRTHLHADGGAAQVGGHDLVALLLQPAQAVARVVPHVHVQPLVRPARRALRLLVRAAGGEDGLHGPKAKGCGGGGGGGEGGSSVGVCRLGGDRCRWCAKPRQPCTPCCTHGERRDTAARAQQPPLTIGRPADCRQVAHVVQLCGRKNTTLLFQGCAARPHDLRGEHTPWGFWGWRWLPAACTLPFLVPTHLPPQAPLCRCGCAAPHQCVPGALRSADGWR